MRPSRQIEIEAIKLLNFLMNGCGSGMITLSPWLERLRNEEYRSGGSHKFFITMYKFSYRNKNRLIK